LISFIGFFFFSFLSLKDNEFIDFFNFLMELIKFGVLPLSFRMRMSLLMMGCAINLISVIYYFIFFLIIGRGGFEYLMSLLD
jgi:hypothetical protein